MDWSCIDDEALALRRRRLSVRAKQPEMYLETQSVPRSKHTPSRLYKPVS